ncbi:hypothetical protein HZC07_04910, partial [Candidatus Micrarchaeota archaeon]|nr:hypothetical protein [Candidatus Micrarchaeota archaeon]
MYDIIACKAEPKQFGFDSFYFYDSIKSKIVECESLAQAVNHKNQNKLIMLKDHQLDDGALRLIGEAKKACILIDLGRLIRTSGVSRAIAISKLRSFLKMCVKYGV